MTPATASDIIAVTAIATLCAIVGLLSLAASLRWPGQRAPALLLAWALLQHAVNQMAESRPVLAAFGGPSSLATWVATVTGYLIAVPWAMLVEQVIGRGWKSSVRRTWQAYLAFAIGASIADIVVGQPGFAAGPSRFVVFSGVLVGVANISPRAVRAERRLRLLFGGYLVFMALVIHDTLAGAGLLPWRRSTGSLGLVIFIASLVGTIVSRTLRGQRNLQEMEHELGTARRIQKLILPSAPPRVEGGAIAFRYVPAAAVAGDAFEFFALGSQRAGILVADVSGHGVAAALIASMVKIAAAAQKPHADDPARVLAGIHAALTPELPSGHFVTAVYVYIDLDRGILRHAAAGHPPALIWQGARRRVAPAGPTGPLLIALAPAEYPVAEAALEAGDRVVLYTDGVVEAMRGDEMFGDERLSALIAACPPGADALASAIMQAVTAFTGGDDLLLQDDCTLVVLELDSISQAVSPPAPASREVPDAASGVLT